MKKKEFRDRIIELLRSDGSIIINKKLAWAIGLNASILYTELVSRQDYFRKKGELDKEGYFFNTVENLKAGTTLTKYQQSLAIKKLVKLGLLIQKRGGSKNKRYIKIKCGKVAEKTLRFLLLKDLVVVKKLDHSKDIEPEKAEKEPEKGLVGKKSDHSVVKKLHHSPNNTNPNNTKKIREEFFSKIGDKKEEKKKSISEQLEELKKKGYKI